MGAQHLKVAYWTYPLGGGNTLHSFSDHLRSFLNHFNLVVHITLVKHRCSEENNKQR